MADKDSTPVFVQAEILKSTKRDHTVYAWDTRNKKRSCVLPDQYLLSFAAFKGVGGLMVPQWWAYQNKLSYTTKEQLK